MPQGLAGQTSAVAPDHDHEDYHDADGHDDDYEDDYGDDDDYDDDSNVKNDAVVGYDKIKTLDKVNCAPYILAPNY